MIPYKGRVKPKKEEHKVNPKTHPLPPLDRGERTRLPAPHASPSAQGKPGRRFGIYLALSTLLLVTGAGWGQGKEWKWLTGGYLRSIKMVGLNGWAIGYQGIILHTSDGGTSWEIQTSGTSYNLRDVSFSDVKYGWAVGDNAIALKTVNGGTSWQVLPQIRPWPVFYRVCSIDSMHVWITSSEDSILMSTNGGTTFETYQISPLSIFYLGVDFVDTLRGWACGTGGWRISKTTDGGRTWTTRQDSYGTGYDLDMIDSLNGWAAIGGGTLLRTDDGWNTWIPQNTNSSAGLDGISFWDSLTGITVGGQNGNLATIIRTTNGGAVWTVQPQITQNFEFYGVSTFLNTNAMICGESGSLIKTTDNGANWTVVRNADIKNFSLFNTYFYDKNLGWSVGTNGAITHTANGGTVWRRQVSGTFSFLYGVIFADSQYGKICTDGGGVLGTRNGGNTWAGESTGAASSLWSIDYPDTAFAVAVGGYYGPFDSSTVRQFDGSTVTEVPPVKQLEMLKQVQHDEEKGIRNDTLPLKETSLDRCKRRGRQEGGNPTAAYRTITRTTNGGATWLAQNTNANPLYGVKFITRSHGWACGDGGTVLHTTDLGATWQTQSTGVTNGLYWITFQDTLHGWACGSGGRVLWTTDGGNAWNIGNSGVTQYLNSIAFTDTLTGFAVSDNGLIIRSTDGGRNWTPDTSKVYANLTAVCALDSTHVWTVGSFGMVLGWGEAGNTGIEERVQGVEGSRVQETALGQSYPNPTRGIASFEYELGKAGKVRVKVYNVAGQVVRTLVEGMEPAGRHIVTWDGRDAFGRKAGSGTYFYCLEAGDRKAVRKMVVIR